MAYKNRNSYKEFNESRCVYFSSFFSLFSILMVIIFDFSVRDKAITIAVEGISMLIGLSVIWTLFYGERVYRFYKYPDENILRDILRHDAKTVESVDKSVTSKTVHSVDMVTPSPNK